MIRKVGARGIFTVVLAVECEVAFALRMMVLTRPIDLIDKYYVVDDTYYTMTVARSIAEGHGPTASAGVLTSGFQPLLAFLLVPLNWVIHDPRQMVRADLAVCFVADVAMVVVIALLARRVAGPAAGTIAGLLAGGIWALSPTVLRVSAGGLETSVAMLCEASFVLGWLWARDHEDRAGRFAVVGVLGGLAILARIDAAPLVLGFVVLQLLFGRRRSLGPMLAGIALTLAPWWGYSIVRFGSPIPQSGVNLASTKHAETIHFMAAIAGESALFGPFATASDLQGRLAYSSSGVWTLAVFEVLALVTVAVVIVRAFRRPRPPDAAAPSHTGGLNTRLRGPRAGAALAFAGLAVWSAAIALFYTGFRVRYYVYRYVAPTSIVTTLFVACGAAIAIVAIAGRTRASSWSVAAMTGVLSVALLVLLVPQVRWVATTHHGVAHGRSGKSRTSTIDGQTGYRRTAEKILHSVPRGSTVAAIQSGALGWYAKPFGDQVVNLDGLVNPKIKNVLDFHATCRELIRHRVDYLGDNHTFLASILDECPASLVRRTSDVAFIHYKFPDSLQIIRIRWDRP